MDEENSARRRSMKVQQAPGGPQLRPFREDGWTPERRQQFLTVLAETCNVREAARTIGVSATGAYYHKQRDPGFARQWDEALSFGYEELHALLLREALFGREDEEVTLDGEGVVKLRKLKRGRDRGVALRLLITHREAALRMREASMREQADGADAIERLRAALLEVRARMAPALAAPLEG